MKYLTALILLTAVTASAYEVAPNLAYVGSVYGAALGITYLVYEDEHIDAGTGNAWVARIARSFVGLGVSLYAAYWPEVIEGEWAPSDRKDIQLRIDLAFLVFGAELVISQAFF